MDSTYYKEVANQQFAEQFRSTVHQPEAWIYMGTVPSRFMPGHVVDRYHNFVTGRYEDRNVRKEIREVK